MTRNYGFDFLRFIAAIAVVAQHLNGQFIGYEKPSVLFGQNFLSFSTTFAVPVFLIISGYLYAKSSRKFDHAKKNTILLAFTYLVYASFNFVGKNFLSLSYNLFTISILWYLKVLILLQLIFLIKNKYFKYFLLFVSLIVRTNVFPYELGNGNNLVAAMPFFIVGLIVYDIYDGYKNNVLGFFLLILGFGGIFLNIYVQQTKMGMYMLFCATFLFMGVLFINNDVFKPKKIYEYSLWFYLCQMLFLPTIRNMTIFNKIYEWFGKYVFVYEIALIFLIFIAMIIIRKILSMTKFDEYLKAYGM